MNFDGLKDDIIRILSGEHVYVNTLKFQNDMRVINSKNDVLTVFIHLGYLAYDEDLKQCYIPNKEVADEFLNAVEDTSWERLVEALTASRSFLPPPSQATSKPWQKASIWLMTSTPASSPIMTKTP
ncbi:MAG: hypothetical protein PUC90_02095 [Prevotella sp.]|nr:hypothetical protein [Prevotella sp.]